MVNYTTSGAFQCAASTHLFCIPQGGRPRFGCVCFPLLGSETMPPTAVLSHTQGSVGQRELTRFSREVDT